MPAATAFLRDANVAQLVEQRFRKARVVSSILTVGSTSNLLKPREFDEFRLATVSETVSKRCALNNSPTARQNSLELARYSQTREDPWKSVYPALRPCQDLGVSLQALGHHKNHRAIRMRLVRSG